MFGPLFDTKFFDHHDIDLSVPYIFELSPVSENRRVKFHANARLRKARQKQSILVKSLIDEMNLLSAVSAGQARHKTVTDSTLLHEIEELLDFSCCGEHHSLLYTPKKSCATNLLPTQSELETIARTRKVLVVQPKELPSLHDDYKENFSTESSERVFPMHSGSLF